MTRGEPGLAIKVEDLGKRYRIGAAPERYRTLRDVLASTVTKPVQRLKAALSGGSTILSKDEVWALDGASFEVRPGEVVGVIGRNGAGKTTLLKVLSRITEPSRGRVEIRGRVASLLEVGTGFHPELTGRENIFLNGAILGMGRSEIEGKFDEIVAFAEVERFIDTQVKHYSSGMYLRLAFAVAAHLEPEILLVDEVLAVGDASFQRRCLGKMGEVAQSGRTVLFVSHNMEAVQRLCERCIWIDRGRVEADGPTEDVVADYLHTMQHEVEASYLAPAGSDEPGGPVRLLQARVILADGTAADQVSRGTTFGVQMGWETAGNLAGAYYFLRVWDGQGRFLFGVNHPAPQETQPPPRQEVTCWIDENVLSAGHYRISIGCFRPPSTTLHLVEDCLGVAVIESPTAHGGAGFSRNSLFVPATRWHRDDTVPPGEGP